MGNMNQRVDINIDQSEGKMGDDAKKGDMNFDFSQQEVTAGDGGQINQGNVSQPSVANTFGDKSNQADAVLDAIETGLTEDAPDATDEWQPPMKDIRMMAAITPPEQFPGGVDETQPENPDYVEYEQKKKTLMEKIAPHGQTIARVLGTFSAAALETVASSNPIIAGVMAVAKNASGS